METRLFHIFRNTPLGRETLLQSLYFCAVTQAALVIYIPEYTKFLMYFENDVVQVDLDGSYLAAPETAKEHALELTGEAGIEPVFFVPKNYTASTLPDVPAEFDFMCCPRSISDLSSKISLGHIGSRVRRIIQSSHFPVLVTSPCYKEWTSITVFFGGSANSVKALELGLRLARRTGFPLDLFTQAEKGMGRKDYMARVADAGLATACDQWVRNWRVCDRKRFDENLYHVSHRSLLVLGAYGRGLVKDMLFESKMEIVQSVLSNNMLIVGPKYRVKR
ncbi:hypothetical protein JCM14469_35720 [Desulfatiferula olefinivorans]